LLPCLRTAVWWSLLIPTNFIGNNVTDREPQSIVPRRHAEPSPQYGHDER
jgi:hypothetical protein